MAIQFTGFINGKSSVTTDYGVTDSKDENVKLNLTITVLSAKIQGETNIESVLQIEGDIKNSVTISFEGDRSGDNYVKQTYSYLLLNDFHGGLRV